MSEGLAVWSTLFLLGAYHGINPGMGWLFAVARGMQEHRARAVAWSLPPIALGHALSVGAVVLAAGLAQMALPLAYIRIGVAVTLVALGRVQADSQPALPLGRHASGLSRTHHLVVSNGIRARRRPHAVAGGAGGTARSSYGRIPRRGQRRRGRVDPYAGILHGDGFGGVVGVSKIRAGDATPVVGQSGLDLGDRIGGNRFCSVAGLKSNSKVMPAPGYTGTTAWCIAEVTNA